MKYNTATYSYLSNSVIVGAIDEDSAGVRVLATLNEGVDIITKRVFVYELGEAEAVLGEVIKSVDGVTTAGLGETLHVAALCTADTDNTSLLQEIEGDGVDTVLVDEDEGAVLADDLLLEGDDLVNLVVSELALSSNKLLALCGGLVHHGGVDHGLLVLERDVAHEDVSVLRALGHVGVSGAVIKDKTVDEAGVSGGTVAHVHDLDHVKIDLAGVGGVTEGEHGLDDDLGEVVSEVEGHLGAERGASNIEELVLSHLLHIGLELIEELESDLASLLEALGEHARVQALGADTFSLGHELAGEENGRGGTVTSDVILSSGLASNHGSSRVHDGDFIEKALAILGNLDKTSTANKPRNRKK